MAKLSKPGLRKLAAKPFGEWEQRIPTDEQLAKYGRGPGSGSNFRPDSYLNNRYSVQISDEATDWGLVVHLWVQRHDREMPRSWSDLQRIKNELVGPERVAIEVFPAVSKLVDDANIAHLWVLPAEFQLPFSLKGGKP